MIFGTTVDIHRVCVMLALAVSPDLLGATHGCISVAIDERGGGIYGVEIVCV
jgi:hypothetical protein